MKSKLILNILLFAMAATAQAQNSNGVKLYGYIQTVSPGTAAKGDIDESGRVVKSNSGSGAMNNYHIYLSAPATVRIYPTGLWIQGQPYAVNYKKIEKTPVTLDTNVIANHSQSATLVPKTTQNVLLLTPLPVIDDKISAKAKAIAQTNELVVVYKLNGKFYYATLNKLMALEGQSLQ